MHRRHQATESTPEQEALAFRRESAQLRVELAALSSEITNTVCELKAFSQTMKEVQP